MRYISKLMSCVLIAGVVLSCSKSDTPTSTTEKIKKAACEAKADEFFAYIDMEKFKENLRKRLAEKIAALKASAGGLGNALDESALSKTLPTIIEQATEQMTKDVSRGKDSNFCKLKILPRTEDLTENQVKVELATGVIATWEFEKTDKKWRLTDTVSIAKQQIEQEKLPEDQVAFTEPVPGSGEAQGAYTFRKTTWGMSRAEVKSAESANFGGEDKYNMAYLSKVASLRTTIVYVFSDDKLTSGKYVFQEQHPNKSDYITDFKNIKAKLTEKYGAPIEDREAWKNNQKTTEDLGEALNAGQLAYYAKWDTANSLISLAVYGSQNRVYHILEYGPKAAPAPAATPAAEQNGQH